LAISEEAEANQAIFIAEDYLGYTYLQILEAERAGGEISEIATNLDIALDYLLNAKRAFESEEYPTALYLSKEALGIARSLTNDAIDLKNIAENRGRTIFMNRLISSSVLIFLTLTFGYLSWKYLSNIQSRARKSDILFASDFRGKITCGGCSK